MVRQHSALLRWYCYVVACERSRNGDAQRYGRPAIVLCAGDHRQPPHTPQGVPLMVGISISSLLSWGNLAVLCQAPLDGLRPLGEVEGRFFSGEIPSDMGTAGGNQWRILTWSIWITVVSGSKPWHSR